MREILFRGQTRRKGQEVWMDGTPVESKWVYGGVLQGAGDYSIIYGCNDPDDKGASNLDKWPVYTDTLGQYTGLKDKNGKRIFEGDICNVGDLLYKVEFKHSCWWFTILSNKVYCCPAFNSHCGEYCEIIGNIHDNPEMMEG